MKASVSGPGPSCAQLQNHHRMSWQRVVLNISRTLTIRAKGRTSAVRLCIRSLERRKNGKWLCSWSIGKLCPRGAAFGNDPVDALATCITIIGLFVSGTEADGIQVWWQKPGDNAGFPVSNSPSDG